MSKYAVLQLAVAGNRVITGKEWAEAFKELTEREAKILRLRYGKGLTLAAVGKRINCSAGRVLQIEKRAVRKIRGSRWYNN